LKEGPSKTMAEPEKESDENSRSQKFDSNERNNFRSDHIVSQSHKCHLNSPLCDFHCSMWLLMAY